MMLPKTLLQALIFCIAISSHLFAQTSGPGSDRRFEFSKEQMDELKNSTTLFVLREDDMENIEAFGDALTAVWNFTPLQFISHNDLPDYLQEDGYSYFFISTYYYKSDNVVSTWIFLNLVIPKAKYNKKGKRIDYSVYYSRNDLYADFVTMMSTGLDPLYQYSKDGKKKGIAPLIYSKGELRNWNPGILKAYLRDIQSNLEKSIRTSIYEAVNNTAALSRLKKDTLFVPEYALTKFNKFTGNENSMQDPKDIFKKYPYVYKILPVEEFSAKMAKATKETFFLDYVKSSAQKYVSVYSTKEGVIFRNHKPMSYNLKDKDIKDIF